VTQQEENQGEVIPPVVTQLQEVVLLWEEVEKTAPWPLVEMASALLGSLAAGRRQEGCCPLVVVVVR
jgi:hypothetical protein